ncbi:MAG: hypothetical protein HUJ31_14915 [Pseudomonadales bacterium]|nr:hypothetical protein [Pseudomonadales bacterium]
MIGLPGNPVSSCVTFLIIARPYLLKYQGCDEVHSPSFHAAADFDLEGGSRREYLRVRLHDENGETRAEKFDNQGSGVMSSVVWADGLAEVEIGQQIRKGDPVKVYLL